MPRVRRVPFTLLLLALAACHPPAEPSEPSAAVTPEPDEPGLPQTIEFERAYAGAALDEAELSAGVIRETLVEGEGTPATPGKRVSFHFDGYDAATGERVMGSPEWPTKLVIGATATEPLAVVMQEVLAGLSPGARIRVRIPAIVANAGREDQDGELGDLWITLLVTEVDDPPQPHALAAFEGQPLASQTRDGLEIHDYAAGEGLAASDGDRVEFHYVVTSTVGETLLSTHADATPVELTLGANTGVPGLARGLRGVQTGTLRKLVIPAELGFDERAPEPFPRNVPMVMYIEVTRVDPGPERE